MSAVEPDPLSGRPVGVKVEVSTGNATDTVNRVLAERKAGKYTVDVALISSRESQQRLVPSESVVPLTPDPARPGTLVGFLPGPRNPKDGATLRVELSARRYWSSTTRAYSGGTGRPPSAGWPGSRNRQNMCWTRSGVSNRQ